MNYALFFKSSRDLGKMSFACAESGLCSNTAQQELLTH